MKKRRYPQRVAWAANAHHLGLRWRITAELIGGTVLVIAVLALWPHMLLRQGAIGFCVGAVVSAIALSLARFDDPQVRGDLAEQWSAEAFGKVRGWSVTNGLSFVDGDVDHVVVTPSGVLAVETKYRFAQPDARRLTAQRHRDLTAARRAARKITNLLRSKQVGHSMPVTPVLMVWGKGAPDLPNGYTRVDGTFVLDGDHPALWSHLFNAPLVAPATRNAVHAALSKFQQSQTAWADQHLGSLRSICWAEFWTGVREERVEHNAARVKRHALRRRHRSRRASSGQVISQPGE